MQHILSIQLHSRQYKIRFKHIIDIPICFIFNRKINYVIQLSLVTSNFFYFY